MTWESHCFVPEIYGGTYTISQFVAISYLVTGTQLGLQIIYWSLRSACCRICQLLPQALLVSKILYILYGEEQI